MTRHERLTRWIRSMDRLGIAADDAAALRRCEMALHRWAEQECGDGNDYASWAIERDEETGIPYRVTYWHDGRQTRSRVADRETGALKRAESIAARYGLTIRHQTDPRGGSLYVVEADGRETYCNY